MPISIDRFESDELPTGPSIPEQVITFLATHTNQAFTRSEIATALDADANTVSTALSRLESRNLVRHKDEYWAIAQDLDRVRTAYDLHRATETLNEDDGGIDAEEWDQTAPAEPHPSEQATETSQEDR